MPVTAGLQDAGFGVVMTVVGPNDQSVAVHYHHQHAEWLYIISGSASLLLVDASSTPVSFTPVDPSSIALETTETSVEKGDFIGFPSDESAARFAHALRAGEGGVEYLVGGLRGGTDVCAYPL
ncbi:hypothetical protein P7C73_g4756, partial [Tremellales sp. Uapishka_1]